MHTELPAMKQKGVCVLRTTKPIGYGAGAQPGSQCFSTEYPRSSPFLNSGNNQTEVFH